MRSRMRSGLGRRIPSSFGAPETSWSWPRCLGSAKRDRASAILAFATAVVMAVVAVAYGLADRGSPQVVNEPVWMIEPPPQSAVAREEIVPHPETVQPRPSVPRNVAEPSPQLVPEAAPDPVFGIDDPVPTGGLVVPAGNSLALAPDPVQPESVPPLAGPRMLDAVPGSATPVVPKYPPSAEEQGIEGRVVALVTTDSAGNVVSVKIERSAGRDFDESVRRAVLATTFRVPTVNGRARAVAFRMPYSFRLE